MHISIFSYCLTYVVPSGVALPLVSLTSFLNKPTWWMTRASPFIGCTNWYRSVVAPHCLPPAQWMTCRWQTRHFSHATPRLFDSRPLSWTCALPGPQWAALPMRSKRSIVTLNRKFTTLCFIIHAPCYTTNLAKQTERVRQTVDSRLQELGLRHCVDTPIQHVTIVTVARISYR